MRVAPPPPMRAAAAARPAAAAPKRVAEPAVAAAEQRVTTDQARTVREALGIEKSPETTIGGLSLTRAADKLHHNIGHTIQELGRTYFELTGSRAPRGSSRLDILLAIIEHAVDN